MKEKEMKNINKYYFYIFILGLVNAIYLLAIIKQLYIGKAFNFLTTIINLIITLTIISLGIGAYISRFFNRNIRESKLRAVILFCALSMVLVLLFMLLFLPEQNLRVLPFIITSGFVSIPMIILGIAIALVYMPFIKGENLGKLVFFHTLGFGLGQVIGLLFIRLIGANTLFLLMFVLLLILVVKRKLYIVLLIVVFLISISIFHLEPRLESLRNREKMLWFDSQYMTHVYSGWSPYSKIDLYNYDDCIAGVYNYAQQWMTCKNKNKDFKLRRLLYSALKGDVLLIGTGGGMGLNAFNETTSITAVEIDPLVVHLMKTEFRDYNNDAYNNVKTYAVDGRAFLETDRKRYDYIIFEGLDYTFASKFKSFVGVENYLHTKEGLLAALGHLKEDGALLLFFTNTPLIVSKTIASIPEDYLFEIRKYHLYSPINFEGFLLTITKNRIDYLTSLYDKYPNYFKEYTLSLPHVGGIIDNRPFLYLSDEVDVSIFLYLPIFIFLVIISFSLIKKKAFYFYFFLLGTGMIIGELFFINIFRSLFYNYITTFVIISIIFFSGFSIGSYCYRILRKHKVIGPFLMLFSVFFAYFIPWSSNLILKFLFSTIVIFPTAFFMGTFFPLGLSKIGNKEFPSAYLLDSLGVAVGFVLFYILSMLFGFIFSFYFVIVVYIILLVLLSKI